MKCITCSDDATSARVVRLLDDGMALVDTGDSAEEIDLSLVDAAPGDTVLIHAKVAIGKLS
jgi:hydrogenase maturation factor